MTLICLALAACGNGEPVWAVDIVDFEPVFTNPNGTTNIYGFQSWQIYTNRWDRNPAPSTFVCVVVTEFEGTPTNTCDNCQVAWDITPSVIESDCPFDPTTNPLYTAARSIGIGDPLDGPETTYPGLVSQGWVDYGNGWEVHGEAWGAPLDYGGTVSGPSFNGITPFHMHPAQAFDLRL